MTDHASPCPLLTSVDKQFGTLTTQIGILETNLENHVAFDKQFQSEQKVLNHELCENMQSFGLQMERAERHTAKTISDCFKAHEAQEKAMTLGHIAKSQQRYDKLEEYVHKRNHDIMGLISTSELRMVNVVGDFKDEMKAMIRALQDSKTTTETRVLLWALGVAGFLIVALGGGLFKFLVGKAS
mgnify:CR=1 FL=1